MIKIIRDLLLQKLNDIDSGNSNISEAELLKLINCLLEICSDRLSRTQAAEYIGKSKSTFKNYIDKGLIPEGRKTQGFNELSWRKCDLDKYLKTVS